MKSHQHKKSPFLADTKGVAAVEFALLLPVLLILLIGMAETVTALNHARKVSQAAYSIADITAQAETIKKTELADLMTISDQILQPYATTNLKMVIACIKFDNKGRPRVEWSMDENGGKPWQKNRQPPISIPSDFRVKDTYMVIGQVSDRHVPMFASALQNIMPRATSINLEETHFARPRSAQAVKLTP